MTNSLVRLQRLGIKVVGNSIKLFSYLFHAIFPARRFDIPARVPGAPGGNSHSSISSIIWQTNFTSLVTLPIYANFLFNRFMAPEFSYRFVSTEERGRFIEEEFSTKFAAAYKKLRIGAAQADFWRVAVLYKYGGVYLDIDAHLVRSASAIVRGRNEVFLLTRDAEITNYFIASEPMNPKLGLVLERMVVNIEQRSSDNIYELTGPGLFNKLLNPSEITTDLHWRTCNQGTFTNEHFQYLDRPGGKWTKQQDKGSVVAED